MEARRRSGGLRDSFPRSARAREVAPRSRCSTSWNISTIRPVIWTAARELLRPDGRLILQVPNAACWQFLLFGERWNGIDVPRHLIDFRLSDIDSLLDHCGFEVLRHKHFSLRDNPAGMATSLAPWLDPMARRLRHVEETPRQRLWKDLLYVALVCASLPFTLLEAACRAGSTIMVEARKKS